MHLGRPQQNTHRGVALLLLLLAVGSSASSYYAFLFNGCPRGAGVTMVNVGDFPLADCQARCDADAACIALEVNGCLSSAACGGACWLFSGSGLVAITNGNCDVTGDQRAYRKALNPAESARSYSSVYGNDPVGTGYAQSMLDSARAWSALANDATQYMTISLGSAQAVAGVVTQGRAVQTPTSYAQWVLTYQVQTSQDCSSYVYVECGRVFTGNTDQTTSVQAVFAAAVQASCVRLLPKTWSGWPSMRAAVLLASSDTPATIPAGWPQDCDALLARPFLSGGFE
jgi:hypothetical protein